MTRRDGNGKWLHYLSKRLKQLRIIGFEICRAAKRDYFFSVYPIAPDKDVLA